MAKLWRVDRVEDVGKFRTLTISTRPDWFGAFVVSEVFGEIVRDGARVIGVAGGQWHWPSGEHVGQDENAQIWRALVAYNWSRRNDPPEH